MMGMIDPKELPVKLNNMSEGTSKPNASTPKMPTVTYRIKQRRDASANAARVFILLDEKNFGIENKSVRVSYEQKQLKI